MRKHADKKDDIITIRLNDDERAVVNNIKQACNIPADSTVFKFALEQLQYVVFERLGEKRMRWLSSQRRSR